MAASPEPDAEQRVALEVLAANAAFYAAFNAHDIAAMDQLWARDARVACVHPGWNALQDREAVMESWEAILENPQPTRVAVGGESAYVTGDTAYVICRELVGGAPLVATNVFVRESGAWRIVHHHASPMAVR